MIAVTQDMESCLENRMIFRDVAGKMSGEERKRRKYSIHTRNVGEETLARLRTQNASGSRRRVKDPGFAIKDLLACRVRAECWERNDSIRVKQMTWQSTNAYKMRPFFPEIHGPILK